MDSSCQSIWTVFRCTKEQNYKATPSCQDLMILGRGGDASDRDIVGGSGGFDSNGTLFSVEWLQQKAHDQLMTALQHTGSKTR